jgi:outer membrane receptor protein involved in Fe transport
VRHQNAEAIFAPDNIGTKVRLDERTLASDHYDADVSTLAAYAMAEVHAGALDLALGVRFEYFRQDLVSLNPLVGAPDQLRAARRTDVDPLPAIALGYALGGAMRLRASYGNTVSRPQLRELSPFKFFHFTRQRLDEGNPRLGRTYVHNADVRFEVEPTKRAFVGAGFFYRSSGWPRRPSSSRRARPRSATARAPARGRSASCASSSPATR